MTREELDALNDGAVILLNGAAYQKDGSGWYEASGYGQLWSSAVLSGFSDLGATITVIHEGEA